MARWINSASIRGGTLVIPHRMLPFFRVINILVSFAESFVCANYLTMFVRNSGYPLARGCITSDDLSCLLFLFLNFKYLTIYFQLFIFRKSGNFWTISNLKLIGTWYFLIGNFFAENWNFSIRIFDLELLSLKNLEKSFFEIVSTVFEIFERVRKSRNFSNF